MKRQLLKKMFSGFMIMSIVSGQMSIVAPAFARNKYSTNSVVPSGKTDPAGTSAIANGPRTKSISNDSKKSALSDAEKKISTNLLKLSDDGFLLPGESRTDLVSGMKKLDQYIGKTDSARTEMKKQSSSRDDLVYVYVQLRENVGTSAIDSAVWEVTGRDEENHLAVAYVEVSKVKTLATLPEVALIRTVTPPRKRQGSVTAQGDLVNKTAAVRSAYSQQGAGVKIGLVSDGVQHIASAKSSGDLPSNVTVLDGSSSGDEGTSMLEIIYDMAPGASLYYHDSGDTMVSFNAAVDELIANGCKIIVDDMGWDEEPFFENGPIGNHMASVMASKDVVFVSAAGNDADVHYQGAYYADRDYEGYHDFSRGTSSSNKGLYVTLPAGEELDIALQWNDRFGSSGNDFDLEIYDIDAEEKLDESKNTQDGDDDPLETLYYTNNTGRSINIEVDVVNYDASTSSILELYLWPSDGEVSSANIVAADSIYGHPNVKGVMAVGAISADDAGYDTIEYYSSRGPTTIIGESQRNKPDIIALDDVSVSGAGDFDIMFSGTSAAAPAVGAIIAQLWGAFPNLKGTEIRDAVLNSAVDLGASGNDFTYGYGRADALRAYQTLNANATPKSSERTITSFILAGQAGVINESNHTVTVNLPAGTNVTSIAPTIAVSAKASIISASGVVKDFTGPVVYAVTSEDGITQTYVITVNVASVTLSSAKAITSFILAGQTCTINETNHSISVNLPTGTSVSSLIPSIIVSSKASVSPAPGTAKNFTNPTIYTVTAEDGSTQAYVITANVTSAGSDKTSPVVVLIGSSSVSVTQGTNYSEQGATATDNVDGSVNLTISGSVNTGALGNYTIVYTATDAAGNIATAVRTVRVVAAENNISGGEITSFRFASLSVSGVIDETNHRILLTVPYGTNVTSLVPTINVSSGASVNPQSAVAQNFSVPKIYTVASSSGTNQSYTVTVKIDTAQNQVRPAVPAGIVDGDIIQCKSSADPNAVYIVKIVGKNAYIRHIVSLQIFNYYKHLKWENLRQVGSLDAFSLSGWVRVNTGANGTPRAEDKVWEVNGDQTRHWINMTAQQFLTHGGSDEAIYTINQGELNLYAVGPDVMSL